MNIKQKEILNDLIKKGFDISDIKISKVDNVNQSLLDLGEMLKKITENLVGAENKLKQTLGQQVASSVKMSFKFVQQLIKEIDSNADIIKELKIDETFDKIFGTKTKWLGFSVDEELKDYIITAFNYELDLSSEKENPIIKSNLKSYIDIIKNITNDLTFKTNIDTLSKDYPLLLTLYLAAFLDRKEVVKNIIKIIEGLYKKSEKTVKEKKEDQEEEKQKPIQVKSGTIPTLMKDLLNAYTDTKNPLHDKSQQFFDDVINKYFPDLQKKSVQEKINELETDLIAKDKNIYIELIGKTDSSLFNLKDYKESVERLKDDFNIPLFNIFGSIFYKHLQNTASIQEIVYKKNKEIINEINKPEKSKIESIDLKDINKIKSVYELINPIYEIIKDYETTEKNQNVIFFCKNIIEEFNNSKNINIFNKNIDYFNKNISNKDSLNKLKAMVEKSNDHISEKNNLFQDNKVARG